MKEIFELIEAQQKMINIMAETISEITSTLKTHQKINESVGNILKSQEDINASAIKRFENLEKTNEGR